MNFNRIILIFAAMLIAMCAAFSSMPAQAVSTSAVYGDVNRDLSVNNKDVKLLSAHIHDVSPLDVALGDIADINADSNVNVVDLCLLKRTMLGIDGLKYIELSKDLIDTPIAILDASCPSVGDVKMLVFEIEFSDCKFSKEFDAEQVEAEIFGPEDTSSSYYPYESVTAYLERSSYGRLNMTGDIFTYTASGSIADYNDDKGKLVKEVLDYFEDEIDFSDYDADGDGVIDCSAYFVPSSASSDYWWPCSGAFAYTSYTVDGLHVGNIITGNSVPTNRTDYVTTIIHEMGHTMGLPDYYKYQDTSDYEGLHGTAGYEMMDDAYGDYSSLSKLMLGWYCESEIYVYDDSKSSQTFNLTSSQHSPNFVLIPGEDLGDDYFGEYFIIEYVTPDGNNTMWWNKNGGIRILHVQTELYTYDYWNVSVFAYENYGPSYNGDDKVRFVRLVNDNNGFFKRGDVVDSSVSGFAWYDSDGFETVDTNLEISVGSLSNGAYSVTVSQK